MKRKWFRIIAWINLVCLGLALVISMDRWPAYQYCYVEAYNDYWIVFVPHYENVVGTKVFALDRTKPKQPAVLAYESREEGSTIERLSPDMPYLAVAHGWDEWDGRVVVVNLERLKTLATYEAAWPMIEQFESDKLTFFAYDGPEVGLKWRVVDTSTWQVIKDATAEFQPAQEWYIPQEIVDEAADRISFCKSWPDFVENPTPQVVSPTLSR